MHVGDSRGTPSAEPNVIPMIDILLVLLIIFMVSIGKRYVFELQLPQEGVSDEPVELQIVLEVLPGGRFAINQDEVPAGQVASRLRGIYAGRPTKVLLVKGDPRVRYEEVMAAIDVARGAGVLAIGVVPKDVRR